jgi:hypothetical protein
MHIMKKQAPAGGRLPDKVVLSADRRLLPLAANTRNSMAV